MNLRTVLAALVATAVASPHYPRQDGGSPSQPDRLEEQYNISIQGVLDNIGGSGSKAPGADDGVIIASPSTEEPNCTCNQNEMK